LFARSLIAALAALAVAAPAASAHGHHGHKHKQKSVDVKLLALNDFHGNLAPPTGSSGVINGVPAGGVEYLATHIRALRKANRNSVVVAAGDLIGASPLLSALFHDEPTIEAFNKIGLDLTAVGNHEFDEGEAELRRMQNGGEHPEGSKDGDGFGGARFKYLAANVVERDSGRPMFPPYAIKKFRGVKIGFIGMTLEGTPDIVTPSGIANLEFLDEAETANRYARELRWRHGVKAIVVLLHEGGAQGGTPVDINACANFGGAITDIVERTTDDVDLFVTGHTHQPYNCVIDGRRVTSASSFGRVISDIDVHVSRKSRDVTGVTALNRVVTRDVMKAPDMTALIERYQTFAAPLENRVIGRSTAVISRTADDSGESPAGNLIADSQLAATDDASTGNAVAAFMNPGGVRADFPAGDITYGAAFTVQPFGNNLTTITLTGAQLWELLKEQWCSPAGVNPRVLQPSDTVRYTFSGATATAITQQPCAGAANPVSALTIGGQAVPNDASQSYRITVNSFLADGGDSFPVLPQGADRVGGPVDLDAVEAYLEPTLATPIAPPATDRITRNP
jgi:5'-nucleotidase